jgi:hypothetical protein
VLLPYVCSAVLRAAVLVSTDCVVTVVVLGFVVLLSWRGVILKLSGFLLVPHEQ